MDKDILVKVESVSKKFCKSLKRSLFYGLKDIGNELIGKDVAAELRKDEFWAIKDVSFELRRGECLGLIGHNGAGKSTLLKMLNGLIKPDVGKITMKGRISALIELGAGFNPILTGRENIYINASVLGLTKKEIDDKLAAIIDFSEIGDFIDSPVQNYSSGMKVRLGFAIAAQMEPDVLIIDEVLAVGDMGFTIKCLNHISQILPNTGTIFVSHSTQMVARISTDVMLLENGQVSFYDNDVSLGIEKYLKSFQRGSSSIQVSDDIELTTIEVGKTIKETFSTNDFIHLNGESFFVQLVFNSKAHLKNVDVFIKIIDQQDREVLDCLSRETNSSFETSGQVTVKLQLKQLYLNRGKYSIIVGVLDANTGEFYMRQRTPLSFMVRTEIQSWATSIMPGQWEVS
jgi:lipopolysaccharide transport system ATP-binding protein